MVDYNEIGLKSGLEIHRQLDTEKLFCHCPSTLRKDEPDFKIERKLHAVAGESGSVDVAAKHESSLGKTFVYEGYNNVSCLVELDEEPPHDINEDALKIAVQVALLLNCKILPITQIMRKTVIDGSNTSGFQRTVLIARDGYIETDSGRVGIASICLEEDSARIVSKEKDITVYRLDRLGIPLVEIATEPDIKSPSQAKEVALYLGNVLRNVKVRRGLGTIRQDVNLSVRDGKRVELKGFQDIRNIENAMEKEVIRQIDLVKKEKSIAEVRKVLSNGESEFLRPMPGASRMYPETDLSLLRISRSFIDNAKKVIKDNSKSVKEELEGKGLNEHMISLLLKQKKVEDFKELLNVLKRPMVVAKTLLVYPKEIASREQIPDKKIDDVFNKDALINVLEKVKKGKISEHQIKHVLERLVKGDSGKDIVKKDLRSIEEEISKLIKGKPGLSMNAYMGLAMKQFRGTVSGKEISDLIKKHLK